MNFLVWWNPFSWLEEAIEGMYAIAQSLLNTVLYFIAEVLNKVIIYIYGVFNVLCSTRLLDSDIIAELTKRISLLLGILMFFIVIFNCVQYVLDPDKLTDKEKGVGNIVKKILMVVVMLGFSSTAFNMLYSVQYTVINSNIISKLLLPYDVDTSNFGGVLSANLFTSFYRVNQQFDLENDPNLPEEVTDCNKSIEELKNDIIEYEDFEIGKNCLGKTIEVAKENSGIFGSNLFPDKEKINIIDFNGIFLVIFSCGVLYFLFGYCISVGVRSIQLAFLEIISPVAIIGYLLPSKDNIFNKWIKIYFSTYVDVFLRIAIINFAVYLIAVIFSQGLIPEVWQELNNGTLIFVEVLMIMAVLTFAKKAPDLLKDLFPSSGASKLGLGIKNEASNGLLGFGVGATVGALGGALGAMKVSQDGTGKKIKSIVSGFGRGAFKGAKTGAKTKDFKDIYNNGKKSYDDSYSAGMQRAQKTADGVKTNPISQVIRSNELSGFEQQINQNQEIQDYYNEAENEAKAKALKNKFNYTCESNNSLINGKSLAELEKLKDDQSVGANLRAVYENAYNQTLDNATMFNLDNNRAAETAEVIFNDDGKIVDVLDLTSGNSVTDYSTIGAENATIKENMNALYRQDLHKVKVDSNGEAKIEPVEVTSGGTKTLERAKEAKKARNYAGQKNTEIKTSDAYRKAKKYQQSK